jgi:hypothetical protein
LQGRFFVFQKYDFFFRGGGGRFVRTLPSPARFFPSFAWFSFFAFSAPECARA